MHVIILLHNTILNCFINFIDNNDNVFIIAVSGEDFALLSSNTIVTFLTGSTNADPECIQISIIDDDIYEEDQDFSVSIDSISLTTAATIGTPIVITIQDSNGLLQLF